MGRTLHYTATKPNGKPFTNKEADAMFQVSMAANANPKLWTCESFWLDPYDYYPSWANRGGDGRANSWDDINKAYDGYKAEGLSHPDICRRLHADKLIVWKSDEKFLKECHGFTKTQGNELNSLMVYTCLVEVSRRCPDVRISLHDEGEFLYCGMLIQGGRVLPDIAELARDIQRWGIELYISGQSRVMREVRKDILAGMDSESLDLLGLGGRYKSCAENYFKEYLAKAKYVTHLIKECWVNPSIQINDWNIANLEPRLWFDPELWHRHVDIDRFKDYKMSPGTLMDGFNGEGFGLTDEDAESASYRQIALIQKMLGNAGNIRVLGAESKE